VAGKRDEMGKSIEAQSATLADYLDQLTQEGELYEKLPGNKVRCYACGHRCLILDGYRGVCKVRFNQGGTLRVPTGYVGALQCDPTEKKPFFHVYPGSDTLTFGMLGCDLHCSYCQNWLTSQALRDPAAGVAPTITTPEELVEFGRHHGARMFGSSYNEPLITSEWAVEVFRVARQAGYLCAFISNGNATPEVLKYLRPWVDCYKVDLKSMNDRNYRVLGAKLQTVLDTIGLLHDMGFWVEIVTLVVPGFNDSDEELRKAAEFLASISPDIPWHVTAFHKDYKMTDPENTTAATLIRAANIGKAAGLRYVYAGNLPGHVGDFENTRCPGCNALLVERYGYVILDYQITPEGHCPNCGRQIPGIWPKAGRQEVRLGSVYDLFGRMPRPVARLRSDVI
jgi:pyruvate formate lyase activating enzyme